MAITRSWETRIAAQLTPEKPPVPIERKRELKWLIGASLLIAAVLSMVYFAKARDFAQSADLLNLNSVKDSSELLPYLQVFADTAEREQVASRVWEFLERARPLPNVGALARIRVRRDNRSVALLPLPKLKPILSVRTPRDFQKAFIQWIAIYFAAFFVVHVAWRYRRFRGDPAILPALELLTGIGLALALSLRDPLRDTLEFKKFAWGVAAGCGLLLLPLLRPFSHRTFSKWVYTPLLVALGLFLLLLKFGSGPTGSDARVNLGPFQPVELIKILIVFFLAGYFARKWEWLRELRERRLPPGLRWLNLPRFSQALPVMCGVATALVMFFLLKDLGPALVTGFLFLTMFSIARGRPGLALLGVAILIGGVYAGYKLGTPHTVVDRISMWLSPWDNNVRGGDQLAHSLWGFATGGPLGSGPGYGDPGVIPAGHTDLVLSSIGEEWGFAGVAAIAILFAFLFRRTLRAALEAPDEYAMFLAVGLAALIALEMLLISGGALGAIPLSGVVSPFLSFGNTAMLANFLIFAIVLGISNHRVSKPETKPFVLPLRWFSVAAGVAMLALVGKAASIQILHDRELLARDTKVFQDDGVKRPQHNPRLNSMAHELTRGNIYDRNGMLLATSKWDDLEKHRAEYNQFGIDIDKVCSRMDNRHYPFGAVTAHLLGDWRTGENFHASNSSLIEHDQNTKLQGFSDYGELAAVVRYRHRPNDPGIMRLRARDRDIHSTIDARLQVRAAEILDKRLQAMRKEKGALIVMDAHSGDLLAMAAAPSPHAGAKPQPDELLDRARYGQYPPGSTFKLVTAMAALRLDPKLERKTFHCGPLGDGRVGARIPGWNKPIRDDVGDHAHGSPDMARAIQVSCNAYFAQLGATVVGARALHDTAEQLEIPAGDVAEIQKMLPFASYGQGPVLTTPFKMARVVATIADAGEMPQGRWVLDDSNQRTSPPRTILAPELAGFIASSMRSVVTGGTGRRAMAGLDVAVAGKTGTAQLDEGLPHSWFAGFAPYDSPDKRIAFAVVIEHGGYGAQAAAPVARELVEAARDLGIIPKPAVPGGE
jgi:cell division protein FtsI/penicillin-binding protein 2/cell division protein FtsW (lipid II flippase)